MSEPLFHVALVFPEIGGNAGNVGRLCLNVGARLHLVHPLGFQTDEKAVRRAGLDYWKHVDSREHLSIEDFDRWCEGRAVYALSARASEPYTRIPFAEGCVLVFGRESVGLPPAWTASRPSFRIPMVGPTRSLNVANAASVVAYAGLQALRPGLFT
ncbi:MAG: tRNA (cytidine(34)-2'-O)-methyltransferase [Deltaproteobacteria bacterium]|nr:tRNA (cytidine(34)-2'-O)-methyltransferase [Deltaproteobacteria bacterium]